MEHIFLGLDYIFVIVFGFDLAKMQIAPSKFNWN